MLVRFVAMTVFQPSSVQSAAGSIAEFAAADAGRIEDAVETSPALHGSGNHVCDLVLVRDIGGNGFDLGIFRQGDDLPGCLGKRFWPARGQQHVCAFLREAQRGGPADARARARDDCDLAFQSSAHRSSPGMPHSLPRGVVLYER